MEKWFRAKAVVLTKELCSQGLRSGLFFEVSQEEVLAQLKGWLWPQGYQPHAQKPVRGLVVS